MKGEDRVNCNTEVFGDFCGCEFLPHERKKGEAKASYFNNMFNEVKDTGAYWNLIKKATNQNIKNKIGPLKRDDGTLALINKDIAPSLTELYHVSLNN